MENITQPTQPQVPVSPDPQLTQSIIEPKKSFPKWLLIILGLVLLIIFGTGTYFLNQKSASKTLVKITAKSVPTPTLDPTASWKTYTNTQDGYSVKYPATWSLTEETSINRTIIAPLAPCKSLDNCSISNQIFISKSSKNDLDQAQKFLDKTNGKYTSPKIDGYDALRTTDLAGAADSDQIFIKKGQDIYSIVLIKIGNKEIPIELYNQIISTLKFTNPTSQTDPTSNWKSFTNSSLTFKYPDNWIISNNIIQGTNPKVKIVVVDKGGVLMNECMQQGLVDQNIQANVFIKNFTRITTGAMCQTSDLTPREKWIVQTINGFSPGISFSYSSNEENQAVSIFNNILSTFKFTSSLNSNYQQEGGSCGTLAGAGGNTQCVSGLVCKHKNPNDPYDIGICVKQ